MRFIQRASFVLSIVVPVFALAQEPPKFRPRTDAWGAIDAEVLRAELRASVDARGPINPLADYGPPKRGTDAASGLDEANLLDEANTAPMLDEAARKRLQGATASLSSKDLHVVTLLPPPKWTGELSKVVVADDGFRPAVDSGVVVAGGFVPVGGIRLANYNQVDPQANIPPSLNAPTGLPPVGVPSGLPSAGYPATGVPTTGLPATGYPVMGVPNTSVPVPSYPPPGSVPSGVTYGGTIGVAPATMPSSSVPTTVMPAPPSYVVPVQPAYPPGGTVGYAGSPLPTYSRAGTFVNSAPFVSPPPASVDARWMVSPAVWQQSARGGPIQTGGGVPPCPPGVPCPPVGVNPAGGGYVGAASSVVPAGALPGVANPYGAPGQYGVTGVVPNPGLVPSTTASPFAYAPPAAMPPQTIYAPANGGYQPLVGFGQGANAQLGRGLYGQPTAYVDGQPVRNFMRYIFP